MGDGKRLVYRRTLIAALTSLHAGPYLPDSAARDEIQPGLRSLHVARRGRRGHNFVLHLSDDVATVEIVRILHETMDLARGSDTSAACPHWNTSRVICRRTHRFLRLVVVTDDFLGQAPGGASWAV